MVISAAEYTFLSLLKTHYVLPLKPDILEFGENNWYTGISFEDLRSDICVLEDEGLKTALLSELSTVLERKNEYILFDVAKVFYKLIFDYDSISAIDMNGTEAAFRVDLNYPVQANRQFHITINFGTAEHIFNVYQFFKSMHDLTVPGGLMLHNLPFTGWYDHGFYNFQPTFFWDIARSNNYQIVTLAYATFSPFTFVPLENREDVLQMVKNDEISSNSLLFAVFKKGDVESEFSVPMQGYYARVLSEESQQAWRTPL